MLSGNCTVAVGLMSTGKKNTPAVTLEPEPVLHCTTSDCGPEASPHQLLVASTALSGGTFPFRTP